MIEEQKQNLANAVKKPNQNEVLNNLRTEFAQPSMAADPDENRAILSFRSGDFYVGLEVVTAQSHDRKDRGHATADHILRKGESITLIIDGMERQYSPRFKHELIWVRNHF